MRDLEKYLQLQQDIIKHQWDVKGQTEGEEWSVDCITFFFSFISFNCITFLLFSIQAMTTK
jgi:hypothetical protein